MTISPETQTPSQVLLCRSAGRLCAFPLDHVLETMRALPVEAVPGMPAFMLGLAMIRGEATPVMNLAALVGSMDRAPGKRFLTLKLEGRTLALALDEVLGVRTMAAAELCAVTPLLQAADSGMVQSIAVLDAQLMLVLQAGRLFPEADWQAETAEESAA